MNLYDMMLGAKAPNYDTYGLLRAAHFHNPPQYWHIVGYSSHFHAHIGAGSKVLHPLMSKLMCVDLLTLVSFYSFISYFCP